MEVVSAVFAMLGLITLCIIVIVAGAFLGSIIVMSIWALIKPHISPIADRWMDWFDRRTSC